MPSHKKKLVAAVATIIVLYLVQQSRNPATTSRWRRQVEVASRLRTPAGIPQLLHFVYRNTSVLEAYRDNVAGCARLNANWTVLLWTDDAVRDFITTEFPSLQAVFYRFPHKVQRSNAIRYLVLYRFGGVYLDMDIHCRQPLLSSLSNISCFLEKEREHQSMFLYGEICAMNSAMGCQKGHPFFGQLVNSVFNPARLNVTFTFPKTIFETTGPGILTRHYNQWKASNATPPVALLGETYFSPWIDPSSGIFARCRRIVASLNNRSTVLSNRQRACLDVAKMGYEKSDSKFITNLTVAIHQFTHLGYYDQTTKTFDILKLLPNLLVYTGI